MQKDKKGRVLNKKQKMIAIIALVIVVIALLIALTLVLIKNDIVQPPTSEKINKNFSFLVEKESTEIQNDDIFSGQAAINEDYLNIYKSDNYTIDNPYVIVNPFVISPQTALIMFKTKNSEEVTLTLKGKHDDDLVTKFESSKDHYLPVYGLYGDYENEVTIETESGAKKTLKIQVNEHADTGAVTVLENKVKNTNGEFYFATSSLGMASIAYDNYGEVRWWLNIGYSKGMTMLQNGHILLSSANEGPDVTSTSGVVEVDMLGYVYKEYEIEGGYHHDAYEQPDGNLLILTSKLNSESFADQVILLNRKTGKVDKKWDLRDTVVKVDPNLLEEGMFTWGWINSIYYDTKTSSLILSLRNQNSVMAIDYETGNIKWILGESKYWSDAFNEYLIKGVGDNFIYPAGQHSVYITDEGYLSIFNNGYNANHEQAVSCASIKDNSSYAMLYNIDYAKKEAQVVWQYGGNKYFS